MSRLVRLYPRAWRERYQDEFEALLEDRSGSIGDAIDTLRGAVDAHLHPQAADEVPQPWTHRLPGLLALSAGLTWSAIGVRMTVRGAPTIIDPSPHPTATEAVVS